MKNVRFYLEYPTITAKNKGTVKNLGNHEGNCIAVLLDIPANPGNYSALSAVYMWPNSDTNFGEVDYNYLREKCKRVPERICKQIHPKLYTRLLCDVKNFKRLKSL